ncbi:hypothetical protein [Campylobacter hepaticus]|uniref:hypothetical protein n=1 Tax=Campylobacter hepaticus TaxID=1813019 RepID=UPI00128D3059|nr:hypothetical protein [Campylobacter hepaticus]MDX2397721.1 hypothetical protein [Campylobacter hepaticus]
MLIWQTLAIFNFMLPVQVAFEKGAMAEVGILDAVMGLGMICSSILLSKKNMAPSYIINSVYFYSCLLFCFRVWTRFCF